VSGFQAAVHLIFLVTAACFVIGLHLMNSPATASRGNRISAAAMGIAVLTTVGTLAHDDTIHAAGVVVLAAGLLLGSALGAWGARIVKLTDMPQLVSLFNAAGGGAAAIVAVGDIVSRHGHIPGTSVIGLATVLDVGIGAVTFAGSLVAAGKLQGLVSGNPLVFPGSRLLTGILAVVILASACVIYTGSGGTVLLVVVALAALGLGVLTVLPIGGADMPVVISLLNACTGTAVAMAGFVLDSVVLIIAGALVGASGGILTRLMAAAMNRSVLRIMIGGFGTSDTAPATGGKASLEGVRTVTADDVAIQLAYASKVVIVPGYGLAAAQAQHELAALATQLQANGVHVVYAIHPVAGRMPGHMNVLLAEANVPYEDMRDLDQSNVELPTADVALVVGANDVTNPAARRPGSAISGMPILDVDKAASIIVIKRSMGHGYAGIDNELYTNSKTGMMFADAKAGLSDLSTALKAFVH
jgi:NAD(P) transhydrogenase subunit beta